MNVLRKGLHTPAGVLGSLVVAFTLCVASGLLAGCPEGPEGPAGPAGDPGPAGSAGSAGSSGSDGADGSDGMDGADGADGAGDAIGPGLNVIIDGVVIPEDLVPEVTFTATDDMGSLVGLDQFVGSRDVRFVLAYLEGSGAAKSTPVGQYFSYVADEDSGAATYDHHLADGLTQNADGSITYKFETAVPEDYDATATHQVGAQFTRTNPLDGGRFDANAIYTFLPDGGMVTETREITDTNACNQCHTRISIHGRRTELQYCILCHTPQSEDPDTGNTVDMPVLIHKIHMGANLPSVQAGTPYQIIGYRNSVHDYSEVHFPQDVNNCTACHVDDVDDDGNLVVPHSDAWKMNPTLAACNACHDDVNFETGEGHLAGPQPEDSCSICHTPAAIQSVHIKDYAKLVLETSADAISVDETTGLVTFTFSASDTDGNAILDLDDDEKYRVGYLVGWPAIEYEENVGNSHVERSVTNHGDGTYTYAAEAGEELPVDSAETFGFVFRGRSMIDANGDAADGNETRVPMEKAALTTFRTDGGEPEARRVLVDDEACAACHGEPFAGHGSDRIGVDVCLVCHNPNLVSEPDEGDPVTVNMKEMIHKIHSGADLAFGYTTGGHGGDVDFTEIHFPGRYEQCSICHGDHDISLPLPEEALSTVVAVDDDDDPDTPDVVLSETLPERAACTSCHDDAATDGHALLQTEPTTGVETCAVCHGSGSEQDVAVVHDISS